LPLAYHHSHFLAATLDFTSFFIMAFLGATHVLFSWGCFGLDTMYSWDLNHYISKLHTEVLLLTTICTICDDLDKEIVQNPPKALEHKSQDQSGDANFSGLWLILYTLYCRDQMYVQYNKLLCFCDAAMWLCSAGNLMFAHGWLIGTHIGAAWNTLFLSRCMHI